MMELCEQLLKYSLLVSWNPYIDVARDIANSWMDVVNHIMRNKLMIFRLQRVQDNSWWCWRKYSRCEVETAFRWTTYRRKEYNVESDYLFFNLFEQW